MGTKKWSIKYSPDFKKEWRKLDPSIQKKVIDFFSGRINDIEDPKVFAKTLTGNLKSFWRYRVGNHRLICEFREKEKVIYFVRIAHRREVYE
ncbi:MAG TPA: type II toxin-antitoxin system mRNA interferase toxin, RelE/StbE family [Holosporales bacterium]|nr:type II toxin-antitoxin system mRNA interferase toxin, RelE/StbE family [Holosporales bacterium]